MDYNKKVALARDELNKCIDNLFNDLIPHNDALNHVIDLDVFTLDYVLNNQEDIIDYMIDYYQPLKFE